MRYLVAALTVVSAGCGRFAFDEDGAVLGLGVQSIDFANVGCGETVDQELPVSNNGGAALRFEILTTLSGVEVLRDGVAIGPQEQVELAPGDDLRLTVRATAPAVSSSNRLLVGDILFLTDIPGAETVPVRVSYMTVGGVVEIDRTALDYGELLAGQGASLPLVVTNAGDADISATLGTPSDPAFSVTGSATAVIAPGTDHTFAVALATAPASDNTYTATLPLMFSGGICQPPPPSIDLSGVGTTSQIRLDRTKLDFGQVTCPSPVASETVAATNGSAASVSLTATEMADPDNRFAPGPPAPTSIAAGATTDITWNRTPITIPTTPQSYVANLRLRFNGSIVRDLPLEEVIRGPFLSANRTSIDYGNQPPGKVISVPVELTNSGNSLAEVDLVTESTTTPARTTFTASPQAFQIVPGDTKQVVFTVTTGSDQGTFTGTITIRATDQCSTSIDMMLRVVVGGTPTGMPTGGIEIDPAP